MTYHLAGVSVGVMSLYLNWWEDNFDVPRIPISGGVSHLLPLLGVGT